MSSARFSRRVGGVTTLGTRVDLHRGGTAATMRDVMSQLSIIRFGAQTPSPALAESRPVSCHPRKARDRVRAGAVETASLIRAWMARVFPGIPRTTSVDTTSLLYS